jgi:TRAP-type C4-dicarboxylate transport system permease small subunit
MNIVKKISDILYSITGTLAGILIAILTIASFTGVIFRFIFNNPIVWLFEFSILCFSWIIFFGVAMAFRTGDHMNLTFVVSHLPAKLQYIWKQGIYLICIIFFIIALKEGIAISKGTWFQSYNTIPLPVGLFYLALPVNAVPAIIHIIMKMLELENPFSTKNDHKLSKESI